MKRYPLTTALTEIFSLLIIFSSSASGSGLNTIKVFFSLILIFLSIFYFLKDGAQWKKTLMVFSPLPDADDEKIINRLKISVNAVVKGYLFIAVVQGTLLGLGFL